MNNFFQNGLMGTIIYKNNHVANIYEACTCCYDNTKNLNYIEKKEYIEKRINAGHESILEHGRLAIKIYNINLALYITELTTYEYSRYLEFYTVHKEDDTFVLVINGSMRAYKYFFTNTTQGDYDTNPVTRLIHKLLIENTVGELYGNTFAMYDEKPMFIAVESFRDESDEKYNKLVLSQSTGIQYDTLILDKTVDVATTNRKEPVKKVDIGIDTNYIADLIDDCDLSDEALFNILTVTVVFKNMSRTATHQLVRHRNAITQESQRYVDSSNATFTIPVPEYDGKEYEVTINEQTTKVDLYELANMLMSVYGQLVNQGMKKEEARAFLPSNVNCRRLYMTYSLYNLLAFLRLRTDQHAQYEIRQYALAIAEAIKITFNLFNLDIEY